MTIPGHDAQAARREGEGEGDDAAAGQAAAS